MRLLNRAFIGFLTVFTTIPVTAKTMVYWSDSGDDVIRRKPVDGSSQAEIIINPGTNIYTMAVDSLRGKIYWTQQGGTQTDWKLWKANIDGSSPVVLNVNASFYGAEGMAVDSSGKHIYWQYGGVGGDDIWRADLDGGNAHCFVLNAGDGRDLHVIGDYLYWCHLGLHRTPLNGNGATRETLVGEGERYKGMRAMGIPYYANDPADDKLYWGGWETLGQGVYMSSLSNPYTTRIQLTPNGQCAMDFAIDPEGGYVYWTHYGSGMHGIGRAKLDGTNVENFCTDNSTSASRYLDIAPDRASNDDKANAIPLLAGDVVEGWTIGATGTDITLNGYNDSLDVWYYFEPTTKGKYTIQAYNSTFDTTLAILDENNKEVEFNDDFWGEKSAIILKAKAGKRYYIRVAGYDEETGDFTLSVQSGAIQPIQGDLNYDGDVNMDDLSALAQNWMTGG